MDTKHKSAGLAVGRMVHYVSYGTPGGEYQPEHRAAVVTAVRDKPIGIIDLCVLNPTGFFFNQAVKHSDTHEGGTWHWPEYVD